MAVTGMAECKDCIHFEVCAYERHDLPVCDSFVPAADVAPVRHGHTIPADEPKKVLLDRKCVKCDSLMLSTDVYCPMCGARMDGDG